MPISVISHATRHLFAPILFVGALIVADGAFAQTSRSESAPADNQRLLCYIYNEEALKIIYAIPANGTWAESLSRIACQPGQRVIFDMPRSDFTDSWHLSLLVKMCDIRYPIMREKGMAACIYAPVDSMQRDIRIDYGQHTFDYWGWETDP